MQHCLHMQFCSVPARNQQLLWWLHFLCVWTTCNYSCTVNVTHTHAHTLTHTHTHRHPHAHTHKNTHKHACTHMYTPTYAHTHTLTRPPPQIIWSCRWTLISSHCWSSFLWILHQDCTASNLHNQVYFSLSLAASTARIARKPSWGSSGWGNFVTWSATPHFVAFFSLASDLRCVQRALRSVVDPTYRSLWMVYVTTQIHRGC